MFEKYIQNKIIPVVVVENEEEIRNNNLGRSNCIVNKWDTLQFYLKVISRMPGQASNTQYVVCYSNRLDNEAIIDNEAYDEDVRIDDYVKQLKNYFLLVCLTISSLMVKA